MSRIGKQPHPELPAGVERRAKERSVTVKGPKGTLSARPAPEVDIKLSRARTSSRAQRRTGRPRDARAFHGMTRALINNMVIGVTKGYEKTLEYPRCRLERPGPAARRSCSTSASATR